MLLLAFISTDTVAQKRRYKWNDRRYELHAGIGLSNFMGDVCSPRDPDRSIWVVPLVTTGYTADAMLKYRLKGRHFISSSVFMGYMGAKETKQNEAKYYYRDGIAFKSFFTEVGVRYEFEFIKEKRRRNIYRRLGETRLKNFTMPSYVFAGVGGIVNLGKFEWNDFMSEPKGKERYNSNYFNVAPTLMVGLGTKVRLNRTTYFGLEAGTRMALGDGLDNCLGREDPTADKPWKFGKWIDQYQFITASVVFTMREKRRNHMPNFHTIGRL